MKHINKNEVARAFILSNELEKEYSKMNNLWNYKKIFEKVKKRVASYSNKKVWNLIKDKKRVRRYKSLNWYLGKINIKQTGLWPGMGHISNNLVIKDAKWSANKIYDGSKKIIKGELNHLFRILPLAKYLNMHIPLILVEGGTIRKDPYLKQKYDIDDGCHRAVCLALMGRTLINSYVGLKPGER